MSIHKAYSGGMMMYLQHIYCVLYQCVLRFKVCRVLLPGLMVVVEGVTKGSSEWEVH